MTELLEAVFKEASQLPEADQDKFARQMLEELQSERKWIQLFAASETLLDQLANEALMEQKKGEYSKHSEYEKLLKR